MSSGPVPGMACTRRMRRLFESGPASFSPSATICSATLLPPMRTSVVIAFVASERPSPSVSAPASHVLPPGTILTSTLDAGAPNATLTCP